MSDTANNNIEKLQNNESFLGELTLEQPKDGLIVNLKNANDPSIIKVIGVGGGGGNAVANMYREGIHDVNFLVCNTDRKALESSPVPERLQLGPGLGAGGKPEKGRELAEASLEDIKKTLDDNTRMVFITAGMGGGTGTGASPIIAREARARGILTVGIVTIPFLFEMQRQIDKALDGVDALANEVDALLVVNNERLKDIYSDLSVINGFKKADETLSTAVRSIVEMISMHGIENIDFRDVEMVLRDGGVAIMSNGYGRGQNRLTKAIDEALHSPLLNNNDIFKATRFLMCISFNPDETKGLQMEELNEVTEFMNKFRSDVETKWGLETNPELDDKVKVTIVASGFGFDNNQPEIIENGVLTEMDERKKERRERIYGTTKGQKKQIIPHNYLFSTDDLDNEDLVMELDAIPAYKRTREQLKQIESHVIPETATTIDLSEPYRPEHTIDFTDL